MHTMAGASWAGKKKQKKSSVEARAQGRGVGGFRHTVTYRTQFRGEEYRSVKKPFIGEEIIAFVQKLFCCVYILGLYYGNGVI